MDEIEALAARYPIGAEVRNILSGRHAWVVGVDYSPRDDVRIVQVDYRDGTEPAASTAEYTELVTDPRPEAMDQYREAFRAGPPASARKFLPDREGNGTEWMWSQDVDGVPHGFSFVLMPSGERRYSVRRYNGYGDDGTVEGRKNGMGFDCAWSNVASWTEVPPSAAELSESCNRGRPVVDVAAPSAEVLAGASERHHDGPGASTAYGVIVYRSQAYGENYYKVTTCSTARYRDEVLVPFYGYYDNTTHIDRFGPDLRAQAEVEADCECGDMACQHPAHRTP